MYYILKLRFGSLLLAKLLLLCIIKIGKGRLMDSVRSVEKNWILGITMWIHNGTIPFPQDQIQPRWKKAKRERIESKLYFEIVPKKVHQLIVEVSLQSLKVFKEKLYSLVKVLNLKLIDSRKIDSILNLILTKEEFWGRSNCSLSYHGKNGSFYGHFKGSSLQLR